MKKKWNLNLKHSTIIFFVIPLVFLGGCTKAPPSDVNDVCSIFRQYPKWYWATKDVQTRWKVPIPVQMAIMHQESRFNSVAKPPRTKLLWIIPWKRPSSAYGYTQALEGTWKHYKRDSGNYFVSRDDFSDATDFVGWYAYQAHKKAGIARSDPYRLYLAYHEGVGGYKRRTYLSKPWLMAVARKVKRRAAIFRAQLSRCEKHLGQKPWYRFW